MSTNMPMDNLWMESGAFSAALLIHTADRVANVFVPIPDARQGVDAEAFSGVIPLRGASYQLLPVFK